MYLTTCNPRYGLKPHRSTRLFDEFFKPFNSVFEDCLHRHAARG